MHGRRFRLISPPFSGDSLVFRGKQTAKIPRLLGALNRAGRVPMP